MDTSNTLTLNGATVSVDGLGFRGGAGMQLTGGGGANTDYRQPAPATYTGAAGGVAGYDAPKGEGIAGTPFWVESGVSFLATNSDYPSGTAGTDGSMARGAPGNAGGGGTVSYTHLDVYKRQARYRRRDSRPRKRRGTSGWRAFRETGPGGRRW